MKHVRILALLSASLLTMNCGASGNGSTGVALGRAADACPEARELLETTIAEAGGFDFEIVVGRFGDELDYCRAKHAIAVRAATGDWPAGFDPVAEGLVRERLRL